MVCKGYCARHVGEKAADETENLHVCCPRYWHWPSQSLMSLTSFFLFFLLRLGIYAASNSAYSGYPELWIFMVSCSQIPRRAFTGIQTHDPLVESPTS
jgi:hypothetical protein